MKKIKPGNEKVILYELEVFMFVVMTFLIVTVLSKSVRLH